MNKTVIDFNKIVKEWAYRVDDGKPNPNKSAHLYHLSEILIEYKWPLQAIDELLQNLNEVAPTDMVSNPNPKGRVDKVQYQYAKQWLDDNPDAEPSDDFKKDVDKKEPSNEPISGIKDIQSDLENKRDKGEAGVGGPIASQGEARYCNAMNNHDDDNFKKENREVIDKKKEEFKNKKLLKKEERDLEALGLEGDEGIEYLATREVYADKELERIKKDEDSVFYKKGKSGFNGRDEDYKEWMRSAYDGTLSTRKILEEDTDLDTSKPNTTMQSETEVDDKDETATGNGFRLPLVMSTSIKAWDLIGKKLLLTKLI